MALAPHYFQLPQSVAELEVDELARKELFFVNDAEAAAGQIPRQDRTLGGGLSASQRVDRGFDDRSAIEARKAPNVVAGQGRQRSRFVEEVRRGLQHRRA